MTRNAVDWYLVAGILVFLIVGCAGGPPEDIVLAGDLVAAEDINPNREGRPSPVTVAVFMLKSPDAFLTMDFFNLYDADSGVLAGDEIERTDLQVWPGQSIALASDFDPETTHIGILAAFRDIDRADWRAIVELPEGKLREKLNPFSSNKLIVRVEKLSVTAAIEKQ